MTAFLGCPTVYTEPGGFNAALPQGGPSIPRLPPAVPAAAPAERRRAIDRLAPQAAQGITTWPSPAAESPPSDALPPARLSLLENGLRMLRRWEADGVIADRRLARRSGRLQLRMPVSGLHRNRTGKQRRLILPRLVKLFRELVGVGGSRRRMRAVLAVPAHRPESGKRSSIQPLADAELPASFTQHSPGHRPAEFPPGRRRLTN